MSFARAKIDAQKILLTSRRKALAVCLLGFTLRLICIFCTAVSLYSLLHLSEYPLAAQSVYAEIGFYALFTAALLLSLWLFALLAFLQKRWFLESTQKTVGIFAFFYRLRFSQAVKIGFLYYVKKVLALFDFLFYLLPFFIFTTGLFYEIQTAGISKFLWYFSLVFSGVLLCVGVYFGFAAVQKYAFCDALLSLSPQKGLIDTLKTSRKLARQSAFSVVRFKLRFTPWVLCSFLLLPAFYALPYYRQSIACMTKTILDKNHLTKPAPKPIVFFVQARKPLQA
ncbi:MAG: hypothetical protein ACI4LB_08695 [Candidatus Fimenecus sp.]